MRARKLIIGGVLLLVLYQAAVRAQCIEPSPKGVWFWRGVMMSYNHFLWLAGCDVTYYVAGPAWEPVEGFSISSTFDHALLFREYTIAFRTGQIVGAVTSGALHVGIAFALLRLIGRTP